MWPLGLLPVHTSRIRRCWRKKKYDCPRATWQPKLGRAHWFGSVFERSRQYDCKSRSASRCAFDLDIAAMLANRIKAGKKTQRCPDPISFLVESRIEYRLLLGSTDSTARVL